MRPMDRRRFLLATAATAATAATLKVFAQGPSSAAVKLTLHSDQPGAVIPRGIGAFSVCGADG